MSYFSQAKISANMPEPYPCMHCGFMIASSKGNCLGCGFKGLYQCANPKCGRMPAVRHQPMIWEVKRKGRRTDEVKIKDKDTDKDKDKDSGHGKVCTEETGSLDDKEGKEESSEHSPTIFEFQQ